jgi:5-deoxy-glucuronate isomerase
MRSPWFLCAYIFTYNNKGTILLSSYLYGGIGMAPTKTSDPVNWKYVSPDSEGLHKVVTGKNSSCKSLNLFRLNLSSGSSYTLMDQSLEMSAGIISGRITMKTEGNSYALNALDSFYIPAKTSADITAEEDTVIYIGAAVYEGEGEVYVLKYDANLPDEKIRQVHGKEPYRRDVFMTLGPHIPASRLITGFTWSDNGAWSSWPPHQHTKDLDECYCYFDMDPPKFGLHLSYRESGKPETAHIVSTGDFIVCPEGYHPTVATPGIRNSYFWVLAAHSIPSRRYDLAVNDPAYT